MQQNNEIKRKTKCSKYNKPSLRGQLPLKCQPLRKVLSYIVPSAICGTTYKDRIGRANILIVRWDEF